MSATAADGPAVSATANGQAVSASVFDPCLVSPRPKAGERKTKGSRKRRHSALLTDTPEKRALEEERKKRKSKLGTRGTRATVSRKAAQNTRIVKEKKGKIKKTATKASVYCSSDEDDWFCIVCGEPFSDARKKKDKEWIQCTVCHQWSHLVCTDGDPHYVCENCYSD